MRPAHRVLTGLGMAVAVGLAGPAAATATTAPAPAAATATTTTLTSSVASSSYDSWVTFTARVTAAAGIPAGSVTFADVSNGSVLATEKLANGTASFTTAALAPGSRSIAAHYLGGSTFGPSTSAAFGIPVAAAGSDAVAYQIDARHDGDQSRGRLQAGSLTKKWRADLNGPAYDPLIARGRVFVMTNPGGLYALNAATGHTEWRDAYDTGTVTYDGQEIFALTQSGTLTAYTASIGHKLWTIQLPLQATFTAPPTAYDGVVYVSGAGVGGTVYAVSEADGRVRWMQPVQNGDDSSPAVDDSGAYVSYSEHQDYRFSLAGSLVWNYAPSGEGGGGSTPVLHGASVYTRGYPTFDSPIILSKAAGKLTGAFATDAEPAFDNTSMYTLQYGNLVAVDPSGSPNRWTFAGQNLTTAPVISNGVVYASNTSGTVYGVSAATGTQVWSGTAGDGDANGTGMAVGGGLLVVPAGSTLTAFGD
ncbi:MAG TPA: PQQ-binding-like beta-propeller repeat protein [Streptosporangiaceae bacterium]|nr:PQQ-binding-like beta-propeller repeat protein [Streptosporangiaceae bacterium]